MRPEVRVFGLVHQAAWHGCREAVENLLTRGADPMLKTKNGQTAREVALEEGNAEVAELLAESAVKEVSEEPMAEESVSALPTAVQELMELLCDDAALAHCFEEFKYDTEELAASELTDEVLTKAFESLKPIAEELAKPEPDDDALDGMTAAYYEVLPRSYGREKPPIDSKELLRQELQMLESLGRLSARRSLMEPGDGALMDLRYQRLKTELAPVDKASADWKLVEAYLRSPSAYGLGTATHQLTMTQLFKMDRAGEKDAFEDYEDDERQLLWHGEPLTSWCGLLSHGPRLPPDDAPEAAYAFGKGISFFDRAQVAAAACRPSKAQPKALLLLAEVALGDAAECVVEDSTELPRGKKSRKALGKTAPSASENLSWGEGVVVPAGPETVTDSKDSLFNYNEHLIYDVDQIRSRFLVQVEVAWK
jgi:poly [ADP-ribose] polymerase